MTDNGWRRNKNGGLFNINDYMNNKIRKESKKTKDMVLYHGSSFDFNEFDDDKIGTNSLGGLAYGKGHYFTDEKIDIYGKNKYQVKVSIKKPFEVQEREWGDKLSQMGYKWGVGIDQSEFLASKGYDATIIKNGDKKTEIIVYTNKDKKIKIIKKES